VAAEGGAGTGGDRGQGLTPVGGQLVVGNQQFTHDGILHEGDEVVFGADVVVQRHRPRAQLGSQASHGDRLDAFGVGDRQGGLGDLLAAVAGTARARLGPHPDRPGRLAATGWAGIGIGMT
jgi:hypothetical protein